MPDKLLEPTTKVVWRIRDQDLALMEAIYGHGRVNTVAREWIERNCDLLRERLAGQHVR